MKTIITAQNVIKVYGKSEEKNIVLNNVNIDIHEGEFIAVMGPSGSGKTTLMFALSGMDAVDSGSVIFNGQELARMKETQLSDIRRREMGFVFQQPTMLKNLNILDNIILPAMRDGRKNAKELTIKAKTLMEKTGIANLEKRGITQVSGGQLQRAGICRALMNTPQIIFGDEPTGALNSKSANEIMELLTDINNEGTAVVLVTHDVKIAAHTQRVLFMKDGAIINELTMGRYSGNGLEQRIKSVNGSMQQADAS